MSATTSKHQDPSIRIDTSRVYKVDAGQCPKCGNFKTWQFRIKNPNSGKMMPGHVTAEGYIINDGECPYYALLRKTGPKAQEQDGQDGPDGQGQGQGQGQEQGTPVPAPVQQAPVVDQHRVAPRAQQAPALHATAAPGGGVTITLDGKAIATASKVDALKLCSRVLDIVAGGAP